MFMAMLPEILEYHLELKTRLNFLFNKADRSSSKHSWEKLPSIRACFSLLIDVKKT